MTWNRYLRTLGLPEVDIVGNGLPDAFRLRDLGMAAAILMGMRTAAPIRQYPDNGDAVEGDEADDEDSEA